MRIVLTGSSGRIGRAVHRALSDLHDVTGIDLTAAETTLTVGDVTDAGTMKRILAGADAIVHVAALHAPHVGACPESEFVRVNVDATRRLAEIAREAGVPRFVFTSTTALYGHAVAASGCTWIDESTAPVPRTIYHRTKLEAERVLEEYAGARMAVRVLRMARCFPEPADVMAVYRLHRGIDAADVADAHAAAVLNGGPAFQRHVIAATPAFVREDCEELAVDAAAVIARRTPELAAQFLRRGWALPRRIDRVYASASAKGALGFEARRGYREVLANHDRGTGEAAAPTKA